MIEHLSVSQYTTYQQCRYRWFLQKVLGVPQRPAAWLSQGTAVHKAMEEWARNGVTGQQLYDIYYESYDKSIAEQAETEPNLQEWFNSGPYDGPADIERRRLLGVQQLGTLTNYYSLHPEEKLWTTPRGELAVELPFSLQWGPVTVKGFIDEIVETPKGIIVRDIKTGTKPKDPIQLETYATAVYDIYGMEVAGGDFLLAKTGKTSRLVKVTAQDRERVRNAFQEMYYDLFHGSFPGSVSAQCNRCPVREWCLQVAPEC